MKLKKQFRESMEWALMLALVLGCGAMVQAQEQESQPEGRIVQIGPDDSQRSADAAADAAAEATTTGQSKAEVGEPSMPRHWIGLLGGPVTPELRAHLEIPSDQGVLVRDVVPDSPAAEAGLKAYDILLRANETPIHNMGDLVSIVRTAGEQHEQIALEILRHGQIETVSVTPAERPEQVAGHGFGFGPGQMEGWSGPDQDAAGNRMRRFNRWFHGPGGGLREFHSFQPGQLDEQYSLAELPNGVSVNIQRENGQPPRITVQRGEQTWVIEGDDPGSLRQLPDDVRPFVDQLLHPAAPFGMPGQPLPEMHSWTPELGEGMPDSYSQELHQRMEEMERQIQELQNRLLGTTDKPQSETQ